MLYQELDQININNNSLLVISWKKIAFLTFILASFCLLYLVFVRVFSLNFLFCNIRLKSIIVIYIQLLGLKFFLLMFCTISSEYNNWVNRFLMWCSVIAILLIVVSGFIAESKVYVIFYIPIFENIFFIIGVSLFYVVILFYNIMNIIYSIIELLTKEIKKNISLLVTKLTTSSMFLLVWVCGILSFKTLEKLSGIVTFNKEFFYQMVFYSSGHMIQFMYIQVMIYVWLELISIFLAKKLFLAKKYIILLAVNFFISIIMLSGHIIFNIEDFIFKKFFLEYLKYSKTINLVIFIFLIYHDLLTSKIRLKVIRMVIVLFTVNLILFIIRGPEVGYLYNQIEYSFYYYHVLINVMSSVFMLRFYVYDNFFYIFGHIDDNDTKNSYGVLFLEIEGKVISKKCSLFINQIVSLLLGQILSIITSILAHYYNYFNGILFQSNRIGATIYLIIINCSDFCILISYLMFIYFFIKSSTKKFKSNM